MAPRIRHITLLLTVLVSILWVHQTARAEGPSVARGVELYNDLEYEKAAATLEAALASPTLDAATRVRGYKHLGLAYVVLGRPADAREAFEDLLAIDPGFRLERTQNPRALDLFEEARQSLPAAPDLALGSDPGAAGSSSVPPGAQLSTGATADPGESAPIYRRWWFWASVTGVVATSAAIWLTHDNSSAAEPEAIVDITIR